MPLVTIQDLSVRFRGPPLFEGVSSLVDPGERIGLLGRNGAGKTTLMKVLAGSVEPDRGSVLFQSGCRVALLPQGVPLDIAGTVQEVVRAGVTSADSDWEAEHKVDQILSRMELDPAAAVAAMSSGMKRRVLLARTLVDQPDLLLLDEPTNHLDLAAILWLEEFLLRWPATLMFVTHDRQFLRRLANRIWEIDAGRLFDWACDYPTFLKRKEEALAAQEKQDALFDKRLAEEEVWIRQGIKARRTRNEGRVRRLEEMRRQRSDRRSKTGIADLKIQEGARSGNLVTDLQEVSYSHRTADGELTILDRFSTTIMRGDAVGIIGPNGSGKTTLLKVLLGERQPQSGTVRIGTNLQIAYFDQLREQLDEDRTIEENVADGLQAITVDGKPRHVISYLQDFLFTAERARTQVRFLSGGERSRVLLAKLFSKPANVIVLDEPTNDLDAETMEMLEERLTDYQGTLLVVSHDREFLNNVVTSTIVIEVHDDGRRTIEEFAGGYDDWYRQHTARLAKQASLEKVPSRAVAANTPTGRESSGTTVAKLSFKEQRELDQLPDRISQLETQIAALHQLMADPAFYKSPGDQIAARQSELQKLESGLAAAWERWESLEGRRSN